MVNPVESLPCFLRSITRDILKVFLSLGKIQEECQCIRMCKIDLTSQVLKVLKVLNLFRLSLSGVNVWSCACSARLQVQQCAYWTQLQYRPRVMCNRSRHKVLLQHRDFDLKMEEQTGNNSQQKATAISRRQSAKLIVSGEVCLKYACSNDVEHRYSNSKS